MKYLFFDIESPDGGIGAMCEFGYVITDEQFNVLDQQVITMNPERCFNTGYRKGRPNVSFYFPKEKYLSSPKFPYYYDRIKKLLTVPDTIVLGYSVGNDIRYIAFTSQRYHKPVFNYFAYDVQKMHRTLNNLVNMASLDKAVEEIPLEDKKGLTSHRSDCDAKMTMLVLKNLLKTKNLTINDLINDNYKIEVTSYLKRLEENKRIKQNRKDTIEVWKKFLEENANNDKKTCIVSGMLKKDLNTSNYVINKMKKANLRPGTDFNTADYFIVRDLSDEERLKNAIKEEFKGKYISISDLDNLSDQ